MLQEQYHREEIMAYKEDKKKYKIKGSAEKDISKDETRAYSSGKNPTKRDVWNIATKRALAGKANMGVEYKTFKPEGQKTFYGKGKDYKEGDYVKKLAKSKAQYNIAKARKLYNRIKTEGSAGAKKNLLPFKDWYKKRKSFGLSR
jgi:hypothetical protein